MKVVILAAGIGSRLYPETADKPKAMITINDKPLIHYQVESVLKAGFSYEDIYVLGGYQFDKIKDYFSGTNMNFIYNEHYKSMNNIYSFLLTKQIGEDILLINSDDFYDQRMINLLLEDRNPTAILVDQQKTLTDEAMRVKIVDNRVQLINKQIPLAEADGEYIGISKLGHDDLQILYQKAEQMIADGNTNAWYENVYEACAKEIIIHPVDTKGYQWIEIDDFNDLHKAKEIAHAIL
ncbi:Nucleotidyl transferase [Caldalkalibacillus thermarum TA2.A1]|uniref:Nucleotidyl transferase n=1 Tax=Caldalkalibacillus thermarum (strain TA2.A1) TaxID=986075 RepID=F5L989_CALTT|nr:phosphocholine cytidylyltransferase family protein [Caldalkalibacillus thermarum]EGL82031.1 Nucleotidyl transferase [Caldalkalibacillus thermarum TA2.A1]QZT34050.1 phosphocholine cytidylyltransferase family protein [Caldalkalibacillus thermarum TA2.A1]